MFGWKNIKGIDSLEDLGVCGMMMFSFRKFKLEICLG
jgi:hypothetical protein